MNKKGNKSIMLAERIRELRLENGLSQKELGEKINSTSKNIWAYENKISTPPVDVLVRLADYFDVTTDYLLGREDACGVVSNGHVRGGGSELDELVSVLDVETKNALITIASKLSANKRV